MADGRITMEIQKGVAAGAALSLEDPEFPARLRASSISSICRSRWRARRASAIFLYRMPKSHVRTLDRPSKRGAASMKVVNVACVTSSACWGSRPAPRAARRIWTR